MKGKMDGTPVNREPPRSPSSLSPVSVRKFMLNIESQAGTGIDKLDEKQLRQFYTFMAETQTKWKNMTDEEGNVILGKVNEKFKCVHGKKGSTPIILEDNINRRDIYFAMKDNVVEISAKTGVKNVATPLSEAEQLHIRIASGNRKDGYSIIEGNIDESGNMVAIGDSGDMEEETIAELVRKIGVEIEYYGDRSSGAVRREHSFSAAAASPKSPRRLPYPWELRVSTRTRENYYFNSETGESQWDPPEFKEYPDLPRQQEPEPAPRARTPVRADRSQDKSARKEAVLQAKDSLMLASERAAAAAREAVKARQATKASSTRPRTSKQQSAKRAEEAHLKRMTQAKAAKAAKGKKSPFQ